MDYQIVSQGTYPVLEVTLAAGESFVSESGAMAWMDPGVDVTASVRGGVLAGLGRKLLTGESFFQSTYTTAAPSATVALAAGPAGAIRQIELAGDELFLERGAYLASTPEITIESKYQGLKKLLGEGMFALRATGQGTLFFSGYGDVEEVQVAGEYIVDNGFAVAWDATLDYDVTRAKKVRSFLFGDQIIMRFRGHGRVWAQSRSSSAFANWIHPFRRVQQRNG